MANDYLLYLEKRYRKELSQGYEGCKKFNLLLEIAYLDRLLAKGTGNYVTALAKEQLKAWEMSPLAFIHHPEQVDWIIENKLHKHIAAHNHLPGVNEKYELLLPTEEGPKPVSELMERFHLVAGRLIELPTGVVWSYSHCGLQKGSDVYRLKERKTKDWRLEIGTDVREGLTDTHSFVNLRSATGKIYSFRKMPHRHVDEPSLFQFSTTIPSTIHSPDISALLPEHKATTKVTKIDLCTEENFNKALTFLQNYQSDFNIIDRNCGTLPHDVCQHLGFQPRGQVTVASFFLPFTIEQRKFFVRNDWIQTVSHIVLYPLKVIMHLAICILGGLTKHVFASQPLFSSILEVLDPCRSLIYYPPQLRAWQEVVEEDLGKRIVTLKEMQDYTP